MAGPPSDNDLHIKMRIAELFSRLSLDSFEITSEATLDAVNAEIYNCIAWAAGQNDAWWWPENPMCYWPLGVPNRTTLDAFVEAFRTLGYELCDSPDLEHGYEKVAIYVDRNRIPTHAARQLENGRWTSKLGPWEDIEHDYEALTGHVGQEYGDIAVVMKRIRQGMAKPTETVEKDQRDS